MKRRIITINEELCNGCGICAEACHEGAIGIKKGKAVLLRDDYCDGLGDCLPTCPTNAISFEEREALDFDKEAVIEHMKRTGKEHLIANMKFPEHGVEDGADDVKNDALGKECKGKSLASENIEAVKNIQNSGDFTALTHWPVQLQLVAENAAFLKNANLLIAADCSAFTCGNFHEKFMKKKVTLVGCPKLDVAEYGKKLSRIIGENQVQSVEIIRMEVPCCGGLEFAVKEACKEWEMDYSVVTLTTTGTVKSTLKNL